MSALKTRAPASTRAPKNKLHSLQTVAAGTEPRPGLTGEQFVARLKRVRRSSNGWECRCPAHEDRTPSLSVADGVEGVVFHCHAMCASEDILRAMGLEWWQLFYRSAFEYKRAYEASAAQACGAPVHSGRFCVGEGIESWRERRRSYAHRLESHLPDFDWELLDAALNYETPDEGMTVAQGKLGKQFGYSQSTVSRRLAPAVETGLLKSEARSRKGRFAVTAGPGRTSNRYRLDTARIALLLKAVKTKAKEVAARALQPKTRVDEMASALVTLTRLETFLYPMYTIEEAGSDHPPGTRIGSSTRLRGTYHDREATGGREDRARSGFVGTASASLSGTNKITVSDWQPKRACASPSSRAPARGRALR